MEKRGNPLRLVGCAVLLEVLGVTWGEMGVMRDSNSELGA